jgi:hypothetical protein
MHKQTALLAFAVLSLATAFSGGAITVAQAAPGAACPPVLGCPPGPKLPDPGNPGNPGDPGNNKPADEGPEFADNTIKLLIACRVPSAQGLELTTDVRFRNIGDATIPQGSRVQWYVEKGQGGEFFLPSDLPVGKELTEADLLKLGVPAKTDCMSKLAA